MPYEFSFYLTPYLISKIGFAFLVLVLGGIFFMGQKTRLMMEKFAQILPPAKALLLALVLGLGLRAAWISVSPYQNAVTRSEVWNETDLINVHAIDVSRGLGITNEDGSPSGRRPPGAIFLLGFFYRVFGVNPWIPLALNQFLFGIALYLLYRLAQHLKAPAVTSLTVLFFAVNPPSVISSNIVMDEHWAIPFWFWSMDLFLRGWRHFTWPKTFLFGIVLGIASFVRPEASVMPYAAGGTGILHGKNKLSWVAKTILMLVLVLAVNLPWAIRNYRAWEKPVYYSATGGFLYATLNPTARGNHSGIPGKDSPYYSKEFASVKNEGEAHVVGLKLATQWMKENPSDFILLTLQKALLLFSPDSFEWALNITFEKHHGQQPDDFPRGLFPFLMLMERLFHTGIVYSFFPLTLLFLFWGYRKLDSHQRAVVTFLLLAVGSRIAMNSVFAPVARYRFQFEPLMFLLALYFFQELAGTVFLRRKLSVEASIK